MRHLLFTFLLLFSLTACQSAEEKAKAQAEHDAKIAQQAREEVLAELKAKEEARQKEIENNNTPLSQVGISVKEKEITINPEKAKDFFNTLGKKIEEKLQGITKDLERGKIDNESAGVHIDQSKIQVDLNKTQDFLQEWGKKMQGFVKEIDNIAKSMDINTTK